MSENMDCMEIMNIFGHWRNEEFFKNAFNFCAIIRGKEILFQNYLTWLICISSVLEKAVRMKLHMRAKKMCLMYM